VGLVWRWALTLQFVVVARILFRADSLTNAAEVWTALISRWDTLAFPRYSHHAWIVLVLGYAVHLSPKAWAVALRARFLTLPAVAWGVALALVGWACVYFGVGDSLTFIYYAF